MDNVSVTDRDKGKFIIEQQTPMHLMWTWPASHRDWSNGFFPFLCLSTLKYMMPSVPQTSNRPSFRPGVGAVNLQFDVNEGANCGLYRGDYLGALHCRQESTRSPHDKDGNTHSANDTLNPSPIIWPPRRRWFPWTTSSS